MYTGHARGKVIAALLLVPSHRSGIVEGPVPCPWSSCPCTYLRAVQILDTGPSHNLSNGSIRGIRSYAVYKCRVHKQGETAGATSGSDWPRDGCIDRWGRIDQGGRLSSMSSMSPGWEPVVVVVERSEAGWTADCWNKVGSGVACPATRTRLDTGRGSAMISCTIGWELTELRSRWLRKAWIA
jgi:hypothetical protein